MQVDILDCAHQRGDPHEIYRELRKRAPVCWDEANGFWIVSRHADVCHASKNPQIFCSSRGVIPNRDEDASLLTMDEPRHTEMRKLVNQGFTPRLVLRLEPRIREIVRGSIDAVAEKGECEFVESLAIPLPLLVIAELLGIPREDLPRSHRWSDTMMAAGGSTEPDLLHAATVAFGEFTNCLRSVIEDRRREPREDLMSVLVAGCDDGIMDLGELMMFATMLLVAGNETTRNALSGGMIALMEHPEEREKLLRNPGLVPTAVEEFVRWSSPVVCFRRTATRDTQLGGQRIREGEQILLLYPSANRDEDVFEDADRFRVDRTPNPHVGFGIGNHFCLGANLARLELRVMLGEILRRLPDLAISPGASPEWDDSPFVRAVRKLPVSFTPEATRE